MVVGITSAPLGEKVPQRQTLVYWGPDSPAHWSRHADKGGRYGRLSGARPSGFLLFWPILRLCSKRRTRASPPGRSSGCKPYTGVSVAWAGRRVMAAVDGD